MFRKREIADCPLCGGQLEFDRIVYTAPPVCEVSFAGISDQDYRRSYHSCRSCGHFLSSLEVDLHKMYQGDYVASNYGAVDGLHKAFLKVRSLAPEKSDNVGRVRRVADFAEKFISRRGQRTVLDIGSGLGVFPFAVQDQGFFCTALDPDPVAVEHLTRVLGLKGVCAVFEEAEDLGRFDVITLNRVLEHVNDPVHMLSRCGDFLAEGGFVYVELPDGESAIVEGPDREEFTVDHIHVFSKKSFSVLISLAGFQVASLERLREPSKKFSLYAFLFSKEGPQ